MRIYNCVLKSSSGCTAESSGEQGRKLGEYSLASFAVIQMRSYSGWNKAPGRPRVEELVAKAKALSEGFPLITFGMQSKEYILYITKINFCELQMSYITLSCYFFRFRSSKQRYYNA